MRFWRRWWRNWALKRLLPSYTEPPEDYAQLVICVPVLKSMLEGDITFADRVKIIDHVANDAWRTAAQQVRERIPIKLPDRYGPRFKEGFSALA